MELLVDLISLWAVLVSICLFARPLSFLLDMFIWIFIYPWVWVLHWAIKIGTGHFDDD